MEVIYFFIDAEKNTSHTKYYEWHQKFVCGGYTKEFGYITGYE